MCLCQICLYSFDKRIMRGVVHLLVTNILVLFIIIEINTTALNNILFSAFFITHAWINLICNSEAN